MARRSGWISLLTLTLATSGVAQSVGQLTFDDALRSAWERNPNLTAKRAELRQADRQWAAARAKRAPQWLANLFAARSQSGAILNSGPTWMAMPAESALIANVMAMVPLSTGGSLEAGERVAWFERQAVAAEVREAEADLALELRMAALEVAWHDARLAALARQAEQLAELERTTQARVEAGKEIEASVLRVRADRSRLARDTVRIRADREKAVLAFRSLVGGEIGTESPLPVPPSEAGRPGEVADRLVALAVDRRGTVQAAQARRESARQEVRMAEGDRRPQWSAVAMADAATMRGMGGPTFGITMSVPLGDGGGRRATVDAARAMAEKRDAELTAARRSVELEVRQALADLQAERANLDSAAPSVTAAEEGLRVISLRLEAGKAILLEQLDALQVLAQARADLAEATYRRAVAQARVDRLTGDPAYGKADPR